MTDQELAVYSKQLATTFAFKRRLAQHLIDELAQEAAISLLTSRAKYRQGDQNLRTYAYPMAQRRMSEHLAKLGGVVNASNYSHSNATERVGIKTHGTDHTGDWTDDRTTEPVDDVDFKRALEAASPRVQLMVEAKIKGAHYEEIAEGLGVSREYVRLQVLKFAESVG